MTVTFLVLPETLSKCQTVWIQIRSSVRSDLDPKFLQKLSADNKVATSKDIGSAVAQW